MVLVAAVMALMVLLAQQEVVLQFQVHQSPMVAQAA